MSLQTTSLILSHTNIDLYKVSVNMTTQNNFARNNYCSIESQHKTYPVLINYCCSINFICCSNYFVVLFFISTVTLSNNFFLPALSVFLHGSHLWLATLYMVIARLVIMVVTVTQLKLYLLQSIQLTKQHLSPLLNYGVWIAITGIVGPLMVYGDRFFVSAAVGAALLPLYAIPQEGLQRLLIIPSAICGALLPKLSAETMAEKLITYNLTTKSVAYGMLCVCLTAAVLTYPFLKLWISPQFATNALPLTLVLIIGIWFNALSLVPYTFIHSLGKPKITAVFHIIELVIYCGALWWLTKYYGLIGAALAWVARVILDFTLLRMVANKLVKDALST